MNNLKEIKALEDCNKAEKIIRDDFCRKITEDSLESECNKLIN